MEEAIVAEPYFSCMGQDAELEASPQGAVVLAAHPVAVATHMEDDPRHPSVDVKHALLVDPAGQPRVHLGGTN